MYQIKMEVFILPEGGKHKRRELLTYKAETVKELWRWVNRKRYDLQKDGSRIVSSRYEVTEV